MPKDPKGRKRPADVIANAVHVMRIATGEIQNQAPSKPKDVVAAAMGRRGALSRIKNTTKARRSAIAQKAALIRWKKT